MVDGCCTACDVPFVEAPGLFAYDGKNHCYVKRQPETKAELNRMLGAVWAAELQCIRYRGEDPDVRRRLGELGEPHLCDVAPPSSIRPVFRNHVTYDTATSEGDAIGPRDLAMAFLEYLRSLNRHWLTYEFTPIVADETTAAFSFSWYQSNFYAIEFCAIRVPDCRWLIRHSLIEKAGSRGVSNDVDDRLKSDSRFCKARWYAQDQWSGSRDWQETPW